MSDNLTSNAVASPYAESPSSPGEIHNQLGDTAISARAESPSSETETGSQWSVHNQLGDPELNPDYLANFRTPPSLKRQRQEVSEIILVVPRLGLTHFKQRGGWSGNLGSDDIPDELSSPVMAAVARVPQHADKGTQAPDMELQGSDEPKAIEKATGSESGDRLDLGVKRKRRHSLDISVSITMKIQRIE
ncbi:hypothetical protein FIBSPDRAFT_905927 [Athelia psychrophila]|uniref:Uncharacterized protein n=1 Tax=Athelia psychrophila TaxID=1759441 RepID=A0A167SXW4_9AGAM|nr:hypothetical protein FIBSPDRAFT_905927 [Fibularhizoctonia sp. CBS 109695]